MSLYRNFFNVSAMTLISRILGFVRDILIAAVLGSGMAADVFFAAFRFPNLFRRLFAEGVFNAAFIPMFSEMLEKQGREEARLLAARIISWLFGFLLIFTILAEIFMPQIMRLFVPGFVNDKEKFELTVLLTRICFPYLAFMSLMAAYGAILNGLGKFLAAAFAPVLLNIVLIITLIALVFLVDSNPIFAGFWLSVGVLIGGVAQLALVIWAVRKTGMMPKFIWPKMHADVNKFWLLALPVILTGGVTQINIFIGTIIASGAGGSISYLYYADRLYQLPLGLIGIAIGVVLLPELSSHLSTGRKEQAAKAMDKSLLFAMVLTLPAAAGLIALSHPIISTLFERGEFSASDSQTVAAALIGFSIGLPAFVLIKIFQPGFFARQDTKTPTYFAIISVIINIVLSLILFPIYKHVGIAIATSVAAWTNLILLVFVLMRRRHFMINKAQLLQHILIILISVALAVFLYFSAIPLSSLLFGGGGFLIQVLTLGALISVGMALYFLAIHLAKVQDIRKIFSAMKRS